MRWLVLLIAVAGCYDGPKPACEIASDLSCSARDAGSDAFDFWPFLLEVSPADAAKSVSVDVVVTVKFTEQVTGVTATSFTLTRQGDADPIAAVVSYDPKTRIASLDPVAPLEASSIYVAALGASIVDYTGHPIYGPKTWSFKTTYDMTAPTVVSVSPVDGASGVAVDGVIVVAFSERVSFAESFALAHAGGWAGAKIGFVTPTVVQYTPYEQLAPFTTYTAHLTSTVTDLIGNPLVPFTWSFTTGADAIAPVVISKSPMVDDFIVVSPTFRVTVGFSEPVVGVSSTSMTLEDASGSAIAAMITYDVVKRTARLTPNAPLAPVAPYETYTVKLTSAITDASGNSLAGQMWSFAIEP